MLRALTYFNQKGGLFVMPPATKTPRINGRYTRHQQLGTTAQGWWSCTTSRLEPCPKKTGSV